jgi:hypothetical protein
MVHDAADVPEGPVNLDSVRVAFTEERLVSDAGLLSPRRSRSGWGSSSW